MNIKVEKALNKQVEKEASSSQFYLSMASWAENQGLNGTANFYILIQTKSDFTCLSSLSLLMKEGERQ